MKATLALVCLLSSCALVSFCNQSHAGEPGLSYQFDTVTFVPVGPVLPAGGPEPNIHIDTNMRISGLFGGSVKTSAPYSIGLDYTDETFTYAEAEFTKVVVSYDDGTDDPGSAPLKLPLRIPGRPYESTNSMNGGRIVKTKLQVISGKIPGVITRDLPVTLLIEGHFIKANGAKVPFAMKRSYKVVRDKSTRPWGEVISGC